MKVSKTLCLLLALCMALSCAAFASSGEASGEASSAPGGGMAAPNVSTSTIDVMEARALLSVVYDEGEFAVTERPESADRYEVEVEAGDDAVTMEGIYIQCAAIDFDTENGIGTNGITVIGKDSPAVFTIGGEEEKYEVDGEMYNSVVLLDADRDEPQDQGDFAEMANGGGVLFSGRELVIDNAYLQCNGYKRSTLYMAPGASDEMVVQNAELVMKDSFLLDIGIDHYILPGFALSKSSSRGMFLESGGPSYLYNTTAVSESWGTLSIDGSACNIYAVGSDIECLGYGYGVYTMAESEVYYYGVRSVSRQSAVTLCRIGNFFSDGLQNASDEALSKLDEEEIAEYTDVDGSVTADYDGMSVLAGGVCVFTNHADMNTANYHTTCICKNTVVTTAEEDLFFYDGSPVDTEIDAEYFLTYDEGDTSNTFNGIGYYELMRVNGADIFSRSSNGYYEFENCVFKSRVGVLWHSIVMYDPMASGVWPVADADYFGNVLILRDMEAEGDVLHEDYMRKLDFQLEACDYSGAVVSGTMANWNNWWYELEDPTQELEAAGWDLGDYKFDRDELCSYSCVYTEYGDPLGVYMTMDGDSSWTVTGDSSVTKLSLAKGAEIKAPEGKSLEYYVDVEMDSDDAFYDWTTGTRVDSLEAGEYTGVVIRVVDNDLIEIVENDEGQFIRLSDLLEALGR